MFRGRKKKKKILLLLALLGVGGYLFIGGVRVPQTESSLRKHAEEVLVRCQKEEFTPNCYDKEIPKLMRFMSMEDAFGVTRYVQEKDPKYRFCHVLAHELRCPATMCNNGSPHGVLMYKFKSESLSDSQIESILPDLKEVCEPRGKWQPSEVEIGMCYHGIGHLNMYITDADIDKSLELCEKIGVKEDGRSYYKTCVQGVFMIVFQGVEQEEFALVA